MNKTALTCLRCENPMLFLGREKLQLGQNGWLLGDLPNLLAGALELDIYFCRSCGKVEIFTTQELDKADGKTDYESGSIAVRTCPACGHRHDIDYPKCPFCRHDYSSMR